MADETNIELTVRLWGTGAPEGFEDYIEALTGLLPRHRGELTRRVHPVDGGVASPDALLVMTFPDSVAIDGFLRDPLRADLDDLAKGAVVRSLITDGRLRSTAPQNGTLHPLRPTDPVGDE